MAVDRFGIRIKQHQFFVGRNNKSLPRFDVAIAKFGGGHHHCELLSGFIVISNHILPVVRQ